MLSPTAHFSDQRNSGAPQRSVGFQPVAPQITCLTPPIITKDLIDKSEFSTCDKESIEEICNEISRLNSAISDAVDRLICVNSLSEYRIQSIQQKQRNRIRMSPGSTTPLVPLMLRYHKFRQESPAAPAVQNALLNALVHDVIIEFIFECIYTPQNGSFVGEYYGPVQDLVRRANGTRKPVYALPGAMVD